MSVDTMTPPAGSHTTSWSDNHFLILGGSCAAFILATFGVAGLYYAKQSRDFEWLYVTLILGLPLLQAPAVIVMLKRRLEIWGKGALILLYALAFETALWLVFTFRDAFKNFLLFASFTGLLCALLLGGVVFWITKLIMSVEAIRRAKYRMLLRGQPFVVVCYFLTVFTMIALFLSLSLALHDQHLRINKQSVGVFARDFEPSRVDDQKSTALARSGEKLVKILFAQGSATVEVVDAEAPVEEAADSDDLPEKPDVKRKRLNRENLEKLANQMINLAGKDHLRVVLAGHSDDQPVDRSSFYKSNFELSQARIHQVLVNLLARLDRQPTREWRRNIEWLILPCANEQGFLDGNGKRRSIERLSVEILLLPSDGDRFSNTLQSSGKELHLLDYIYYGVYTITTTGNGDIIPVSSYAKFLTTVTNFFAIFLLAVFFNVLLSFLREDREDRVKQDQPVEA